MNKSTKEPSTSASTELDAETRFQARAALGVPAEGLAILGELERAEREDHSPARSRKALRKAPLIRKPTD